MPNSVDRTNDYRQKSWLSCANQPGTDFPLQNLPFAIFRRTSQGNGNAVETFRGGVAIGDRIVDLAALDAAGVFTGDAALGLKAGTEPSLNRLMQAGPRIWRALRENLFDALKDGSPHRTALERCLVAQSDAEYGLPARIGDYTDFYISIHHATAVGRLFRPDNPLLPNYKWVPIGYHGRSSSVGISGQSFPRPSGQRLPPGAAAPVMGPSQRLDYELELGIFIGAGNARGEPIALKDAEEHVFGLCLLNDWSARDLQAWEYQPLGPFLAKNFATTISPWIVTLQALAPFRTHLARSPDDPRPLPYLDSTANQEHGAIDIRLEAFIQSEAMRRESKPPYRLSSSSFRHAYWTLAQLIAHHTVNGCDLRAGDLLGTGTQSGPTATEAGSLVELSEGGKRPFNIDGEDKRTFLEDGDAITFKGWCEREGFTRIGFGEVTGRVLQAK